MKNATVLLQGSSSSSRIVLYSVSFQIENDSMATPMKAAAASAGATRRARIGASGLHRAAGLPSAAGGGTIQLWDALLCPDSQLLF